MSKVDTTLWGKFMIGQLFDIYKPNVYHTREVKESTDGIPYIVRSKFNNGMKYRVLKTNSLETSPSGVISFGSENASFFYQEEEWCSGRDIYYIDTRSLSSWTCRFLATCLDVIAEKYTYSFGLFPDLLKKETILLPIDKEGKPDWSYMDAYMRKVDNRAKKNLDCLQSVITPPRISNKITVSSWKKFAIKDMFEANNTGNILIRDIEDGSGSTPYVTASGVNNGVAAMINASRYELIKGNCILVGGKTFTLTYQKEDFVSNDSHNFEMHLKNIEGNCYIYLYLIAVLRATLGNRYFWGDAVTKDKIMADEILLPCDDSKQPNWDYMEAYMETIHNKAISNLDNIEYNS